VSKPISEFDIDSSQKERFPIYKTFTERATLSDSSMTVTCKLGLLTIRDS
jgi:hypothetical protein